ncbi:MAG: DUF5808 domain-containing protein [Acidobacteriota bacterium]
MSRGWQARNRGRGQLRQRRITFAEIAGKQRKEQELLDRPWADPGNWQTLGLYRSTEDPRLIVPKRRGGIGWTLNVAHPVSWLVLLIAVLVLVGGLASSSNNPDFGPDDTLQVVACNPTQRPSGLVQTVRPNVDVPQVLPPLSRRIVLSCGAETFFQGAAWLKRRRNARAPASRRSSRRRPAIASPTAMPSPR